MSTRCNRLILGTLCTPNFISVGFSSIFVRTCSWSSIDGIVNDLVLWIFLCVVVFRLADKWRLLCIVEPGSLSILMKCWVDLLLTTWPLPNSFFLVFCLATNYLQRLKDLTSGFCWFLISAILCFSSSIEDILLPIKSLVIFSFLFLGSDNLSISNCTFFSSYCFTGKMPCQANVSYCFSYGVSSRL